jgi:hypothetical protein
MADSSLIRTHMDVISSDRKNVGQVDCLEGGDKIKLTKQSSPDGQHHHFHSVVVGGSCGPARAPQQIGDGCYLALAARTDMIGARS